MTWPILIANALVLLVALVARLALPGGRSALFPDCRKAALFSPAERSFLGVLEQAVGSHYRVFGKVRIADVVETKRGLSGSHRQSAFNRINAKHLDFLLASLDGAGSSYPKPIIFGARIDLHGHLVNQ